MRLADAADVQARRLRRPLSNRRAGVSIDPRYPCHGGGRNLGAPAVNSDSVSCASVSSISVSSVSRFATLLSPIYIALSCSP
jgi:hypothetical protein